LLAVGIDTPIPAATSAALQIRPGSRAMCVMITVP
jgi:hypothetical protein